MSRTKILLAAAGMAVLLALGAACSNGEAATTPETPSDVEEQTSQSVKQPTAPSGEVEVPVREGVEVSQPAKGASSGESTGAEKPSIEPGPATEAPARPAVIVVPEPVAAPAAEAVAPSFGPVGAPVGSRALQVTGSQTGIWVTGEGSMSLEPDLALLNIGVEARAATVAGARGQAARAMAAIIDAVKAHGLVNKDIQTRSFNIFPQYQSEEVVQEGRRIRTQVLVGFVVSNTASIKIRDLDNVGTIIDEVAEAGGDSTRINGISFTVEDPKPFMVKLREMAVLDALAKAEHFASLTGVSVGPLAYISEGGATAPIVRNVGVQRAFAEAALAAPTAIIGGELELRLTVNAVFGIQ